MYIVLAISIALAIAEEIDTEFNRGVVVPCGAGGGSGGNVPVCSAIYQPVCGQNRYGEKKTFPSSCHLNLHNSVMQTDYQIYSDGNCNDDDDSITIESCPSFCPGNYQPVCGKNNFGEKRTFSNECRLRSENCLKKSGFIIIIDGECINIIDDGHDSCPTICPANYQPICAMNSNDERKTFSNECQLQIENCSRKTDFSIVSDGECTSVTLPVDNCPRFCPAFYQPVCAVNGYGQMRTFGSSCLVTVENCSKNGDYRTIKDGQCDNEGTDFTPYVFN